MLQEGSKVLFSANFDTQKLITKINHFLPVYNFFWRNLDLFFNRWLDVITTQNRVVQTRQIDVDSTFQEVLSTHKLDINQFTINVRFTFLSTRITNPTMTVEEVDKMKGKNSVRFTASFILQQEFTNAIATMLTHLSFSRLCTPHCKFNI